MHVLVGQYLVLERWVGEVRVQLGATCQQGGGSVWVRNRQGVFVETVERLVAPLFGGSVLKEARLHRYAHRW
ncbi:hypothetical protein D3C79_885260 [compost metagenome]